MKRVGGFEYGLVNKQVKPSGPMTKAQRLELARRRQAQLIQAGVRPQYLPLAGRSSMNELKGVDGTTDMNPILSTTNTNGNIILLNGISPGSGSWNRIGRKVKLRSLRCKGTVFFRQEAAGAGANSNSVRISVVWDKQPSGAAIPNFDTIFGGTDQTGAESSTYRSNVRYDNTQRFTVLKDMTTSEDFYLALTLQSKMVPFDFFINLKKAETVYSGQTSPCTIADISTGALYFIARAQVNNANVFTEINQSVFRLRYED